MKAFSIQDCMSVGKKTAIHYVENHMSDVFASYEWDDEIMQKLRKHNYDKTTFEGYVETQRLWIEKEILRFKKAKAEGKSCVVIDFGAEDLEFYTINWPKTIGMNWDIEEEMKDELEKFRECLPEIILFLEASHLKLIANKKSDVNRTRNYFDTYYKQIMPLKEAWFRSKDNVDYLNVKNKDSE